jgi:thymidylate kinase
MSVFESGATSTSTGDYLPEGVLSGGASKEFVARPSDPRQRLLARILQALDSSEHEYVLIHGDPDSWPDVTSDVDLAFSCPSPEVLEPILLQMSQAGDLQLVQRLHYEVPHGYYYMLRIPGPENLFLHLDCLFDPSGINRYRLPTPLLLAGATATPYGRRANHQRQALYLLMKRAVKGRVSDEGLVVLRQNFRAATPDLWDEVARWFGPSAKACVEALVHVANAGEAQVHLKALAQAADRVMLLRHPWLSLRRLFASSARKLKRFLQPTGLFVVILGPDGSGKSTVTGLTLSNLERAFRRTWRFHWRPGVLPKLRRGSEQAVAGHHVATGGSENPPQVSKYRGIVSLARFFYYWLDFVIGYWLVVYPRKAQSTLVIGERYFPDVLVHPQRYGFDVSPRLMRLAARFVPSPDLLIVLTGDPDAIYARKPELPVALIEAQIRSYKEEAERWRWHEVVDTSIGAQGVADRIASLVTGECAHITYQRTSRCPVTQWHVFPTARNPKIWFDDREVLADALHLYHPYSRLGLLAKAAAGLMPHWLRSIVLSAQPNHLLAQRFTAVTRLICTTLNDDALTVSFYMGTAGPHRKLTAQVSRDSKVISYVKIGSGEVVQRLLKREADFLTWLKSKNFRAAEVPQLQAIEHRADETLLFLSPPPEDAARQRAYALDYDDLRFLTELDAVEPASAPLEVIFERMDVERYLKTVERTFPDTAQVVRNALADLREKLGEHRVRVTASHGDFAPWNTLEVSDGRLFVFDWEYADRQGVALSDLFHGMFSAPRLVTHEPPAQSVRRLLDVDDHPSLARVIKQAGISHTDLPAYVVLYLLQQLIARPNLLAEPDPYLVEALQDACRSLGRGQRRPKVLVAAYACEPDSGSEPGVGWQMCQAISREHEVWALTRSNNRARIEAATARVPNAHLHFVYADLPPWARFWKRGERGIQLYYVLWQFAAWRVARRLLRDMKFDVAHHVTFVNDYTFSFLGFLNIPFVWGPIGSNGKGHAPLMSGFGALLRDRLQYHVKAARRVLDPFVWLCALRA